GHDDSRDSEIRDAETVDQSHQRTESEGEQQRIGSARVPSERSGGTQHPCCVQHPRNGEVDTADEKDECLAGSDKTHERRDDENGFDAGGAGEAWVEERSDEKDKDRCAEGDENSTAINGQKIPRSRAGTGATAYAHVLAFTRRPRMTPRNTAMTRKTPRKKDWMSGLMPAKNRRFVRIVSTKAPAMLPSALPRPP